MTALWMLYATAIGCLLAAAAVAAEQLAALRQWPRRWAWLGAVLALLVVPFATPARRVVEVGTAPQFMTPSILVAPVVMPTTFAAPATAVPIVPQLSLPPMPERTRFPNLARFDTALLIGWAAITGLLVAGYFWAMLVLAYRRRRWHRARIDGSSVLIASDVGPAVVGAVRQHIVLPAWTFAMEPAMRALILAHEREHLRARDPLLLHGVTLVAYLLPWNVPLWWMLHRLRLAIELDCDARVLGAGFDTRRYATLLLTVGSRRGFAGRLVAPALMQRKSFLFRRIVAIYTYRPKFGRLRAVMAASAVCMLAVLAWVVPVPAKAEPIVLPAPLPDIWTVADTPPSRLSPEVEYDDPPPLAAPPAATEDTTPWHTSSGTVKLLAVSADSLITSPVAVDTLLLRELADTARTVPVEANRMVRYSYLIGNARGGQTADLQLMTQSMPLDQALTALVVDGKQLTLDSVRVPAIETPNRRLTINSAIIVQSDDKTRIQLSLKPETTSPEILGMVSELLHAVKQLRSSGITKDEVARALKDIQQQLGALADAQREVEGFQKLHGDGGFSGTGAED